MKTLFLFIIGINLFTQLSHAVSLSFGESFLNQQIKSASSKYLNRLNKKNHSTKMEEPPKCANFSGQWSGQCRMIQPDKEETKAIQLNIVQKGCSNLKISTLADDKTETNEINVGALHSSATSVLVGVHGVAYSKWSENGSTLLQSIRIFINLVFGDNSQVIETEIPQALYIENNQLRMKAQGVDSSFDCTFNKLN